MGRTQYAPRLGAILVALVFVLIGVLGTFGHALPAVAGYSGELIGIWSYALATAILLIGVFFRKI